MALGVDCRLARAFGKQIGMSDFFEFKKERRLQGGLKRASRGHSLAEVGPTLWLALIMLAFPLMAFATLAMRYVMLFNAAQLAARAGSICDSYSANISATDVSAVNTAIAVATKAAQAFRGVKLSSITTYIVTVPISGGDPTRQTGPLSLPADSQKNTYAFEVVLNGSLSPLITNPGGVFGSIPGLTKRMKVNARSDVMFENTNHLNM